MGRMLIGIACMAAFAIAGCRDPDHHGRHYRHNPGPSPVIVHHPANGGHSGSIRPPKPPKGKHGDKHKKGSKAKSKSVKPPKNPPKASPKPPAPKPTKASPKQPAPKPKQEVATCS